MQVSGADVELEDADTASTSFVAPAYTQGQSDLTFRLTVTDDRGATSTDEITVSVNSPPTANAGADQVVRGGAAVTLEGDGEDSDGTIESFRWMQVSGAAVELGDADTAGTSFLAPAYMQGQSDLIFRLTVTDDREATSIDEVRVSIAHPFTRWNDLEPRSWWRESEPYSCAPEEKQSSPWLDAGMIDLGGSDELSLIRYFGNGSYLRYGHMGFDGCTAIAKYPDRFHLDPPADPTYYSLGDLDIHVDIARVPADAAGWFQDDGARIDMSMAEAVELLNTYVAAYYRRMSGDRLRMRFEAGNDYAVAGDGSPTEANEQQNRLAGACLEGCRYGAPGGLNRILLTDVASDSGGRAYNGWAAFGLVSLRNENMETIVHEVGHAWMAWPHSFPEVAWRPYPNDEIGLPNPYSNRYDVMSGLTPLSRYGWDHDMPGTLAVNRYAAGWIRPEDVALHVDEDAGYTLSKPGESGHQFLVVHSGRPYAFTTLEVLADRSDRFRSDQPNVYDPDVPGNRRARRYEGVLISRYDQSAGTGAHTRFGPALYDRENPDFLADVGWGRDDHSVIIDGETREFGGGVRVRATRNTDGTWYVDVSGGRVAPFERWCFPIWFAEGEEYDTGCFLDEAVWE